MSDILGMLKHAIEKAFQAEEWPNFMGLCEQYRKMTQPESGAVTNHYLRLQGDNSPLKPSNSTLEMKALFDEAVTASRPSYLCDPGDPDDQMPAAEDPSNMTEELCEALSAHGAHFQATELMRILSAAKLTVTRVPMGGYSRRLLLALEEAHGAAQFPDILRSTDYHEGHEDGARVVLASIKRAFNLDP